MKSVTKKMLTISNDNPGETIRDAFSTSMENRQGPVLIDFPSDMGLVDVKDKLNSPSKPKKSIVFFFRKNHRYPIFSQINFLFGNIII